MLSFPLLPCQPWPWFLLAMTVLGCASSRASDPDIVRPGPGEPELEKLPGPMLGSFTSLPNALIAACNKIMSKPNAAAGRRDQQDSATRWRFSSEYCAWIYYTPEHKYVVSKLTDQSRVDPALRTKTCVLPSEVADSRYPPESIKYIYALHNHPLGSNLSRFDIQFIIAQAQKHGHAAETKDGTQQLSLIAFFSNSVVEPNCDGFHQYIPSAHLVLTWTRLEGRWLCEQTGRVVFDGDDENFSIQQVHAACPGRAAP